MSLSWHLAGCLIAGACLLASPIYGQAATDGEMTDQARYLLEGARPDAKVPFPGIKDWSTLRIRLERSGCYGSCPIYSVEISGDGTVSYVGRYYVAVTGVQTYHIDQEAVRGLYRAFEKAEFFWTYDAYESPITDFPTYTISISFDGHSKTIVDYAGKRAGMPKVITDLEDTIDAVAGTERWIKKDQSD